MDIKIGFVHSPRDLNITVENNKTIITDIQAFLDNENAHSFLIEDNKGKQYLIMRNEVSYVEFGKQEQIPVGFAGK